LGAFLDSEVLKIITAPNGLKSACDDDEVFVVVLMAQIQ
jgi:hypothetical protein